MKPTQALHEAGQSLWLDNITRALLDEGILGRYVDEYSVTGLTSNPAIFDKAIKDGTAYDADIVARKASRASDEEVFFELALADLSALAGQSWRTVHLDTLSPASSASRQSHTRRCCMPRWPATTNTSPGRTARHRRLATASICVSG